MDYKVVIKTRGNPEYEDEPVYWCKLCKSLAIINNADNPELLSFTSQKCYCKDCGSTKIIIGMFDEWLDEVELYKKEIEQRNKEIKREQSEIRRIRKNIIKQELEHIKNNRSIILDNSKDDMYEIDKWI